MPDNGSFRCSLSSHLSRSTAVAIAPKYEEQARAALASEVALNFRRFRRVSRTGSDSSGHVRDVCCCQRQGMCLEILASKCLGSPTWQGHLGDAKDALCWARPRAQLGPWRLRKCKARCRMLDVMTRGDILYMYDRCIIYPLCHDASDPKPARF